MAMWPAEANQICILFEKPRVSMHSHPSDTDRFQDIRCPHEVLTVHHGGIILWVTWCLVGPRAAYWSCTRLPPGRLGDTWDAWVQLSLACNWTRALWVNSAVMTHYLQTC